MLAGAALGFGEALSPLQLLWINLVSDVLPGIGLALEPAAPDIMEAPPPGADEPIVGESDFRALASEAAILGAGAFASGIYGAARHGTGRRSSMLVFTSLVLSQLLHALTCRSPDRSLLNAEPLPPNDTLNGILTGSIGAQAALLLVPQIRTLLGVERLDLIDAAVALAGGTLPFIIGELRKYAREPRAALSNASAREKGF